MDFFLFFNAETILKNYSVPVLILTNLYLINTLINVYLLYIN